MRRRRFPKPAIIEYHGKPIKAFSDYQIDWAAHIPVLQRYELEKLSILSVMGDAPKDFTTDREYRPGHRTKRDRRESYIAKVGSKFYPNESITEQVLTRIGQHFDLKIADSKLRIINGQVRFMSKYFLRRQTEQLTHGAEIYERCLGKEEYQELKESKTERDYFSFQMTCEAISHTFPEHKDKIIRRFVEMLTFDAIVGTNDRHPYNWGVIVPVNRNSPPRFAPVYDTSRALFWNSDEDYVERVLLDKTPLLDNYINRCIPPVGWDGETKVDFFRLIGLIWSTYDPTRNDIEKFLTTDPLEKSIACIDKEFRFLMSNNRRELIKKCLRRRHALLLQSVEQFQKGEIKYAS